MADAMWQKVKPDPTLPYHYWLEDDLNEAHEPNQQILCITHGSTKPIDNNVVQTVNITKVIAYVTCQPCLEWLHA